MPVLRRIRRIKVLRILVLILSARLFVVRKQKNESENADDYSQRKKEKQRANRSRDPPTFRAGLIIEKFVTADSERQHKKYVDQKNYAVSQKDRKKLSLVSPASDNADIKHE